MKIKFKVKSVIHRNVKNNFTICNGKVLKYEGESKYPVREEMQFLGEMRYCKKGDIFIADGEVVLNMERGFQFKMNKVDVEMYEYEEQIVNYIKRYAKGVNRKLIEPIVEAYRMKTVEVIGGIDGYQKIKELNIPKLGDKRIRAIREAVINNENYKNVMDFLEMHNQSTTLASKIVDGLGNEAIADLKSNPYQLINYIDFEVLDAIGYTHLDNPRDVNRIVAGIISYVKTDIVSNGNVYTEKSSIEANLTEYMDKRSKYKGFKVDKIILNKAFEYIAENNLLKMIDEGEETYIYRKDMSFMEKRIAEMLVELCNQPTKYVSQKIIMEKIANLEKENNVTLDEQQVEAITSIFDYNVSVLSGGPGTGKSFTTSLINIIYREINEDDKVLLLAPTGKAAKRLSELCGEEAMTIHRGLNIRPLEQLSEIDEEEKLTAKFIIIDESSMIDIQMMYNLLVRIDEHTKILFVGDCDQLPSVGAGLILRDLMNTENINVIKLEKIFRQALESNIVYNSHNMIKGKTTDYKFEKDTFVIKTNNILSYEKKILNIIKKVEENEYTMDDIVILSPTRKGELGTKSINAMIQKNWNTNNRKEDIYVVSDVTQYKLGDKVIHTKNNYDLDVYNGEVGTIINITHMLDKSGKMLGNTMTVNFGDRTVTYSRDVVVEELELAYCLTIHKSQGSEYPIVINIVSNTHKHMLNRNLLYTAWTRAKSKLYLVGDEEAIYTGASINSTNERKSRLTNIISNILKRKTF